MKITSKRYNETQDSSRTLVTYHIHAKRDIKARQVCLIIINIYPIGF